MIVMANMSVLWRASRAMRRFPEQHDQGYWQLTADGEIDQELETTPLAGNAQAPSCGTKLCGGGWIAFQNAPAGSVLRGRLVVLPDGTEREIERFASEVAGLTESQSMALFFRADSVDEFDAILDILERNPDADKFDMDEALWRGRRYRRGLA